MGVLAIGALVVCLAPACALAPAFSILERGAGGPSAVAGGPSAAAGGRTLELVGPRRLRRSSSPTEKQLQRQLAAERRRHKALSARVAALDSPGRYELPELKLLKREKLFHKDKINSLVGALRRVRDGKSWQLGAGSFGRVLLGKDAAGEHVAIKVVPRDHVADAGHAGDDALHLTQRMTRRTERTTARRTARGGAPTTFTDSEFGTEAEVLAEMSQRGAAGFPKLLHRGRQVVHGVPSEVLVMELLGPSVEELWWASSAGTALSAACVVRLGVEALGRLEQLHAAGYAHNDVKPGNLCLGPAGEQQRELFLVDFGLCSPLDDEAWAGAGSVADGTDGAAPAEGTPIFMSLAAHDGAPTAPADDVESLCYTLAFLATGALPWERASRAEAAAQKRALGRDAAPLTEPLPPEPADAVAALWAEVSRCRACAAPLDYTACRAALQRDAAGAPRRRTAYDWEREGLRWEASGEIVDAQGDLVSTRDVSS